MKDGIIGGLAIVLLAVLAAWYFWPEERGPCEPAPLPVPAPVVPDPVPPKPKPRPRPWGPREGVPVGAQVGGRMAPDGTELQCDLPGRFHQKNTGGSDGSGLCVFASMRHSGLYQGNALFAGLFDWMKHHPGGGYPQKVDAMLEKCAGETGNPVPQYVQVQDGDLEILKIACRSGLLPGVTYNHSPTGRYGGQRIAHMVSLVHADEHWFCVLDNNYPGDTAYEWLTPQEFKSAYGDKGWAVILLHQSPPPPPRARR